MIDGYILSGSGPLAGMEFIAGPLAQATPRLAKRVAAIAATGRPARFWIGRGQTSDEHQNARLSDESFTAPGQARRIVARYFKGSRPIEVERQLPVAVAELETLIEDAFAAGAQALSFELV